MDLLTHIFLPLILIYSVRRELKPYHIILIPFTILPDLDKLFEVGLLHSLVTIVPISILLIFIEWIAGKLMKRNSYEYSLTASFYMFSHLFLDILDGGPVTLLYPFVKTGVGLTFPATIELGQSPFDIQVKNLLPSLILTIPEKAHSYGIFSGFGVASMILFLLIVFLNRISQ